MLASVPGAGLTAVACGLPRLVLWRMRSGGPRTGGEAWERSPPGPGVGEAWGGPRWGLLPAGKGGAREECFRFGDLFGNILALVRDRETQIFFPLSWRHFLF